MLTPLTQLAIAILYDISGGGLSCRLQEYPSYSSAVPSLLTKLESGGLIRREADCESDLLSSYRLARPCSEITLLDILESIGEHLNCNRVATEEMYNHHRDAASKLGVVNHMTRLYLSEIHLVDL